MCCVGLQGCRGAVSGHWVAKELPEVLGAGHSSVSVQWHSRGRLPCAVLGSKCGTPVRPFQVPCVAQQGCSHTIIWWAELNPRGSNVVSGKEPHLAQRGVSSSVLRQAALRHSSRCLQPKQGVALTCNTCPSSRTCSHGLGEKGSPFWSHEMVGTGLPRAGHCRLTVLLALTVTSSTSSSMAPRITGGAGWGGEEGEEWAATLGKVPGGAGIEARTPLGAGHWLGLLEPCPPSAPRPCHS